MEPLSLRYTCLHTCLHACLQSDDDCKGRDGRHSTNATATFRSSKYSNYSKFKVYKIGGGKYKSSYMNYRKSLLLETSFTTKPSQLI